MKKILVVDESHHIRTMIDAALKCAHGSHPVRSGILIETGVRGNKDYGFLEKDNRSHEAIMNGTMNHMEADP